MERKYPPKIFWISVLTNCLFRFFYLFWPGLILSLVGIWVRPCLWAGFALIALTLIVSVIDQLRIRKALLTSTHPDVTELMDILSGPEGIRGVKTWADKRITPDLPGEEEA